MLHILLAALALIGKILLAALLVVLLLLVFALLSRAGVRLRVSESAFDVIVRLGVLRFNVTRFAAWRAARAAKRAQKPPKPIRFTESGGLFGELPEEPQKKTAKKSVQTAHAPKAEKKTKKLDVMALLQKTTDFLSEAYDRLSGDGRVRIRRLVLTAAAPEAADTAVMFGHMNTAVATLLHISSQFKRLDTERAKIGVYSDFCADTPRIDADIEINFSALVLVRVAGSALQTYLAVKKNIG